MSHVINIIYQSESLDICPQLHLKQISQSSGITLLIHTHTPRDTVYSTCFHVDAVWKQFFQYFTDIDIFACFLGNIILNNCNDPKQAS